MTGIITIFTTIVVLTAFGSSVKGEISRENVMQKERRMFLCWCTRNELLLCSIYEIFTPANVPDTSLSTTILFIPLLSLSPSLTHPLPSSYFRSSDGCVYSSHCHCRSCHRELREYTHSQRVINDQVNKGG